ncbi:MAG: arylsulfatase [Lentisphaerae bacterium GWF2_45_14]|nr:MAG: arylsulfatase [Lentisphaerae bacterium GWF2_45_14]
MKTKKPNVLIFFTDQQRFDTTGVHGNPMRLTPNFDRMAVNGTHCFNSFTCQPVCVPARMSLQTGKYASTLEAYNNNGALEEDEKTLGHYFQEAGYTTAYIGKWHMARTKLEDKRVPKEFRKGYDSWLGMNSVETDSDAYSAWLCDNDGNRVELPGYRSDGYADAVIRYLAEKKDKPFFLMSSCLEPHFQNTRDDYPAPEGSEEKYASECWTPPDLQALGGTSARHLPGYYGMVKRLDECLGRIRDALRSTGQLENTIILFTTDHGCHFKTRNSEYKRSPHDSSIRIPMALCGPGFDGGGRIQEMISLVDVAPTLLDACGIRIPESMQGRSFMPLICRDSKVKEEWPGEILAEYCDGLTLGRVVRTHRWTYAIERKGDSGENLKGDWVFHEAFLYDNKADPWQQSNEISHEGYIEVKNVMRKRLKNRMAQVGEPEPVIIEAELKRSRGQRSISEADTLR